MSTQRRRRDKGGRSDKQRILASLRAVGGRGITQADWDRTGHTPDRGPRIPQITRRIHDLRKRDGHTIETRGERDGFAVYVLVREPHQPIAIVDELHRHDDRLFPPPPADAIRGEAA